MTFIPISPEKIKALAKTNGIPSPGSSSIREIAHLADRIE